MRRPGSGWRNRPWTARPSVIFRIVGPAGGEDTLFAWDSGTGPATRGNAPQLVLGLGAPPATPPPLSTEQVIVATLTPTPANVMTAAADSLTATAVATSAGTPTPLPYRAVTPTPLPGNLATDPGAGVAAGLPPLVMYTADAGQQPPPRPPNAALRHRRGRDHGHLHAGADERDHAGRHPADRGAR